jgi:hypothetical protein
MIRFKQTQTDQLQEDHDADDDDDEKMRILKMMLKGVRMTIQTNTAE